MLLIIAASARSTVAQNEPWVKYSKAGSKALNERRLDDAQKNLQLALQELEKAAIRDSRLGDTIATLAFVYKLRKQDIRAEELYLKALEVYETHGGPADKIALTLWNVGKQYSVTGKPEKVEPTFDRALTLAEKAKGPENLLLAGILRSLADLKSSQHRYSEAEAAYKRALPIYEKALGIEHWSVAATLEEYAVLLRKMNRKSEASAAEARAKAIRGKNKKSQPYVIP